MTINATAAILLAMYVAVGEEQGGPARQAPGHGCKTTFSRNTSRAAHTSTPAPSLRLVADIFRFTSANAMSFNPISISGYHMREAGATAVQEVAFTFANGLEYVRRAQSAGLQVDDSLRGCRSSSPRYTDLFEESPNSARRGGCGRGS